MVEVSALSYPHHLDAVGWVTGKLAGCKTCATYLRTCGGRSWSWTR